MLVLKCVGCGQEVSASLIACSRCGTPVGYQGGTPVKRGDGSPPGQAGPAGPAVTPGWERTAQENKRRIARIKEWLAEGKSEPDVIELLLRQEPVSRVDAEALVDEAKGRPLPVTPEDAGDDGDPTKDLLWGGLFLVGGGVATLVSYLVAGARVSGGAESAGYFVFWGAMVYGAVRLVKGLARL